MRYIVNILHLFPGSIDFRFAPCSLGEVRLIDFFSRCTVLSRAPLSCNDSFRSLLRVAEANENGRVRQGIKSSHSEMAVGGSGGWGHETNGGTGWDRDGQCCCSPVCNRCAPL